MLSAKKSRLPFEIIEIIIITFALSWFMKTYLIEFAKIEDRSMLPTLRPNNVVLVDKFIYSRFDTLDRGDIVVYLSPDKGKTEVKRVIGLPGDTVEIRNGYTYINGQPLYEPYAEIPVSYLFNPVIVPESELFVLNDNRDRINDSREFGNLPLERLEGKALFSVWPITSIKGL